MAKVGIVMGSDSDMPIMSKAADILEKLGIDYRIHSADEYMLVSGMEEAVLIYMEAIKNLLEI